MIHTSQAMMICSYCGLENAQATVNCRQCGTALVSNPAPELVPETPPELTGPKFIEPESLEAAFSHEDGFHRARWDSIGKWIRANIPALDEECAWNEAALLWVTKLRDNLGGNYFVLQSGQTILLCDLPLETAQWVLEFAGRTAITIKEHLGGIAWADSSGKDVLLIFSDEDDYYQYLAPHSPDGVQAASGGVCIHSGYTHIALPWHDELDAANTIVHELTHDCLAHLPLPLWLNEGVAMTLQRSIAPPAQAIGQGDQSALYAALVNWQAPTMWDELADRHFSFWTEENIQTFWAGASFHQPGDPNELSYSLAEVMVKLLADQTDQAAFLAFLQAACQDDAGQTASLDILGVDLGEIAGTFLGEGNWRPARKAMVVCWEEAGWGKAKQVGDQPHARDRSDA